MKKYIISSFVILFLVGCKSHKEALNTSVLIPKKFEQNSVKTEVDSIQNQATNKPPTWRAYFQDSLLQSLIDSAIISNFDVKIAYQHMMQARAGIQYTKGIRLPELGVSLGAGVRRFGDYTMDGVGNFDTQFSPNLSVNQQIPNPLPDFYTGIYSTWEIDLWGKLKSKKKAALSRYLSSENGKNLMLSHVVSEVASHYFMLQLLDEELYIIDQSIKIQENALEVVKIQKESGKETELAIQLMNAQVLEAKALSFQVNLQIIELENKLNLLLGRYPQKINRSRFSYDSLSVAYVSSGIPSEMLNNRPDLREAYHNLEASKADVYTAKVAFYPSLNINSSLGYQSFRAALLFDSPASIAYNLAGGLVAPLVNRRALKAELMLSKASQQAAYLHYEKSVVTAFTEVYETLAKMNNLQEMSRLKTEQVKELEKSISTSRILFTSGRANYLEILASQHNYLLAQIDLLQIIALKTQNKIMLFKAIGGGWEK